jgi:O-antigen/teichoic acid export membrane protein
VTLVLRFSAAALNFALGIMLSRALGVLDFGHYSIGIAVVNSAVIVALLGHDSLATREISTSNAPRRYLKKASTSVWLAGLGVALIAIWFLGFSQWIEALPLPMLFLALTIPLVARIRLAEGVVRGVHRANVAQVPDGVARPLMGIVLLLVLTTYGASHQAGIVGILVGTTAAALVLLLYIERRSIRRARPDDLRKLDTSGHFSTMLYLSALLSAITNQAPVIAAGLFAGTVVAGQYAAIEKIALAASLIQQITYLSMSSEIALKHAKGETMEVERAAIRKTRSTTALTLGACILLGIFAKEILGMYGPSFAEHGASLAWLLLLPLVNAVAGPVGPLLTMTRHEKDYFRSMLVSVLVQGIAYFVLLPRFGLGGVIASAVAGSLTWNSLMAWMVWRRLGIVPFFILRALPNERDNKTN